MPTLPWTHGPAQDDLVGRGAVVMATRLELNSYRQVPAFFRAAARVRRQIQISEGAIGVSMIARPLSRTFFTLSAWRDDEAITAMIGTEPHRSAMTAFRSHTAHTAFVSWRAPADATPDWADAFRRLDSDVRDDQPLTPS